MSHGALLDTSKMSSDLSCLCPAILNIYEKKSLPIFSIHHHFLTISPPTKEILSATLGSSDKKSDRNPSHQDIEEGCMEQITVNLPKQAEELLAPHTSALLLNDSIITTTIVREPSRLYH